MKALYPPQSDHDRVVVHLANRGRRYAIRAWGNGSEIVDRGVSNGRRARETQFHFDMTGTFIGANRPFKAWWLLRGLGLV